MNDVLRAVLAEFAEWTWPSGDLTITVKSVGSFVHVEVERGGLYAVSSLDERIVDVKLIPRALAHLRLDGRSA